jgi:phosphoribosylformylglycinamidine cyclo-ligase
VSRKLSQKLSYYSSVNYDLADPAKILAQKEGKATSKNLPFGFTEVEGTRGESAYVFDMGKMYGAFVQEGLGTKSLIAQSIYEKTGVSHFASIAQDTVATFINDLISVGATPVVSNAYWSASSYDWLADNKLTSDFIKGWRKACDAAQVVWGGGETQSLPGIVDANALEFAGSAFGIINPKKRLVNEKNVKAGDAIILIESNGVHANGISMTRVIAGQLPEGYATKLPSGKTYGESLLRPTHLYFKAVDKVYEAGVDIHYLSNITGHGWRKLMRATPKLTYRMTFTPPVDELFDFIAKHSKNNNEDMYGNYNMGAGYALYVPAQQADKTIVAIKKTGLKAWDAGRVEKGPKQVIIEPLGIVYGGERLEVRG